MHDYNSCFACLLHSDFLPFSDRNVGILMKVLLFICVCVCGYVPLVRNHRSA